ncbi:transposase [Allobaculum mucilyticum]|nr:transposase [Allobaculum mucilyticum]
MPGYDAKTRARRWRALDMGTHKVFIVADVKRIKCAEHGVVTEAVPWAFHGSKFTKSSSSRLLFRPFTSQKAGLSADADQLEDCWNHHCQSQKVKEIDPDKKFENLEVIGVDETSYRKGHTYITTVVNQQTGEVVWAHDGFGKNTFEKFYERIGEDCASQIRMVSGDGARWIKNTVNENSPQAEFCIDPYHVVTWAIDALDRMRRRIWRSL